MCSSHILRGSFELSDAFAVVRDGVQTLVEVRFAHSIFLANVIRMTSHAALSKERIFDGIGICTYSHCGCLVVPSAMCFSSLFVYLYSLLVGWFSLLDLLGTICDTVCLCFVLTEFSLHIFCGRSPKRLEYQVSCHTTVCICLSWCYMCHILSYSIIFYEF